MKFSIGSLEYFNSLGFDTTNWRKSVDGTKALVHADAILLVASPDEIELYNHNSPELIELLKSEEWTQKEEEIEQ